MSALPKDPVDFWDWFLKTESKEVILTSTARQSSKTFFAQAYGVPFIPTQSRYKIKGEVTNVHRS